MESGERLWALIGIGKARDAQHQRMLEIQARQRFYASGAIILSFNRKFEGATRDVHLRQKLNMEMPGILNLSLEAMAGVFERGEFTHCSSSETAKKNWRFESDQVEQFVADACEISPRLRSISGDIFKSYTNWAKEMGVKRTLGHNGLTQRLQKLGVELDRGTNGKRMLLGIAIKSISLSDASDA